MKFLEAHAAIKEFSGGPPLKFLLACSAVTDTLDVFVKAHAASKGLDAQVDTLPFDTLGQFLRAEPPSDEREVFVLFPWNLVRETDWRTGLPAQSSSGESVHQAMAESLRLLSLRRSAGFVYIAAPIPPLLGTEARCSELSDQLLAAARGLGATVLSPANFSLSSYFQTGNAFASHALSDIAEAVVIAAIGQQLAPKKVLVTDFDNTLWAGVVGEDGVDNLAYSAEGAGFPFFVYQSLLRKLKNEGTLLVGVSRNDRDLALAPFDLDEMLLKESDFVTILASYHSKSAQIAQVAEMLNLNLDSFVFVDDNPVELEEVRRALPEVECMQFSADGTMLPSILMSLTQRFGKGAHTEEDAKRTDMYRLRAASIVPSEVSGADLRTFLQSLQMKLTIKERSFGDHTRCLQLINKTNQFNINGDRLAEQELQTILSAGGRLIGATLEETGGSHGEVVACLISVDGTIEAFVMSCRVFQRRLEYAFTAWLASQSDAPTQFRYGPTARNEPVRLFLEQIVGTPAGGLIRFDAKNLATSLAPDLQLFDVAAELGDT